MLSEKQQTYLLNATQRWNVKTGAVASGKTWIDFTTVIPKRLLACTGAGLIAIIGNTINSIERNVLSPMREFWPGLVGSIRNNDNTVMVFGKRCFVGGADKISQVARIQGATMEYCYGDEITTWNRDLFEMLKSRLRLENSVFDGTCNPDHPGHWFKEFLDSGADIYCQQYIIDDNPFLPVGFVDNLKHEYAGTVYYDRYILGKWALADGLVYPMFNREKHVVSNVPDSGEYYISVDYGTINPFSAGLWCKTGDSAVRVREYYYDSKKGRSQKTDEEYHEELVKLAGDCHIRSVIVDPSAASFIQCIRSHGRFVARKADNAVLDGIRNTATLLNAGKIKIHESCVDAIREFGIYSWDTDKNEDAVIKENDHAQDEIRYFCRTIMDNRGGRFVDVQF